MKKKTHPDYQDILFVDSSTGHKFVCGSTLKPEETEEFEGKKYPVFRVPVSSYSHPFFTGSKQFIDTEGRVDKFSKKYARKKEESLKEIEKESKKEEAKKAKKPKSSKK
ncbi:MAG: type B 50S ribosomal protein L31 [Parachlamydiales bacterium]|nr:type B 50S ribosomal protein L31 [Parachlamydiales bacterium]